MDGWATGPETIGLLSSIGLEYCGPIHVVETNVLALKRRVNVVI